MHIYTYSHIFRHIYTCIEICIYTYQIIIYRQNSIKIEPLPAYDQNASNLHYNIPSTSIIQIYSQKHFFQYFFHYFFLKNFQDFQYFVHFLRFF
jgi:hypothetical protein